jgi:hypothetical protein
LGPRTSRTRIEVEVYVHSYKITALIDSGAEMTIISPRVVEEMSIPYCNRKVLIKVLLAEGTLMQYRLGTLQLETQPVLFRISKIKDTRTINIIELGRADMLISYN